MVANFAAGGAAINVLAREAGARLVVVDAGVATPCRRRARAPARRGHGEHRARPGDGARARRRAGSSAAPRSRPSSPRTGSGSSALGEMGIGNTTAASALCAALAAGRAGRGVRARHRPRRRGARAEGRGRRARARGRTRSTRPTRSACSRRSAASSSRVLAGVALGCAAERVPVVLDGFITGAAALVAARLEPAAADAMIASHRSPEPGHALVLDALGLEPLLDLGLRLGEGTGAALAMPLVRSALALLNDMASFDDAGVTDAGR